MNTLPRGREMTTAELVLSSSSDKSNLVVESISERSLLEGLLSIQLKATTKKTYRLNLNQFAQYLVSGKVSKNGRVSLTRIEIEQALGAYVRLPKSKAILILHSYQSNLLEGGYLPNSINVKLAAVKAFLKYCFTLEICNYTIDCLKALKPDTYKDTKGTSVQNIKKILATPNIDSLQGKRDYALLRLLWSLGLRRGEVHSLNVNDVDLVEGVIHVVGKGRYSKEPISLAPGVLAALVAWIEAYQVEMNVSSDSPLFCSLSNNKKGHRLSTQAIADIVKKYSSSVEGGKILSPHQIRHSAITAVLDKSNGNVRLAQKLSRHKSLEVLTRYDDNRKAEQDKAIALLDNLL